MAGIEDLEPSISRKMQFGAAQETYLLGDLYRLTKAGLDPNKTIEDIEQERLEKLYEKFPEFRSGEYENDAAVWTGRVGIMASDPIYYAIPFSAATKLTKLGPRLAALSGLGAATGATSGAIQGTARTGEFSLGEVAKNAGIGAAAGPIFYGVGQGLSKVGKTATKLKDPAYRDYMTPGFLRKDTPRPVAGVGADVSPVITGNLSRVPKVMESLPNSDYQKILNAITLSEGAPGGSLRSAIKKLGLKNTDSNRTILSHYKRYALKERGLTSKIDASSQYTPDQLKNIPIKVLDPTRKSKESFLNHTGKDIPEFALIKQEGVIIPDYYFVKPSNTGAVRININENPVFKKIFKDKDKLNKFLYYIREYPDTLTIATKPELKTKIAKDLKMSAKDLFGGTGTLRGSNFNKAKIIAQSLPKYDTSQSEIKQFLSGFKVLTKKMEGRKASSDIWKGLTTDDIKYYIANARTMTIKDIVDNLNVPYHQVDNLKSVLLKAQKESPSAFRRIVGSFDRKIYEGHPGRTRGRFSDVALAPGSKDVIDDITRAGFKDKTINVGGKKETLIPSTTRPQPKLHDQGTVMAGTKARTGRYGLVYDETMEAQQGWNILFEPKTKNLRATQTSTQSANIKQNVFEKKLIKLMDKRQALISEGSKKSFNSTSKLKAIAPENRNKTISELLQKNQVELGEINKNMSDIGVRTLMRIRQPDGSYKIKQFGEVLSGMTDFLKKRQAGLLKDGGRAIDFSKYRDTYADGGTVIKYRTLMKDLAQIIS